ncbi:major facilitator superfamily domain-containing protein [Mrakia frigida]|uniref:MFS transporter n=1 Tax=Mrakia frigida TaxID=29902 RepID=UPI003FCC15AA
MSQGEREKGLEIKLVTFTEGDKEDPRNWSKGTKWLRTIVVAYTCFAVALGSSLVVMDMPDVAADLGISLDIVHLTISVFVFGFGIGPLFFAPLSEVYGRRPIIIVSMGLYFVFTFPSAFAKNAASLVVGRALAGLAASAPMTVIGGSIADMWDTKDRGLPMAIFSATVFMGPCLGPVIGGYLSAEGWRACYYLLLGVAGSAWAAASLLLPETYAVVLLRRRAEKLRKETGDQGFMTQQERFKKPVNEVIKTSLLRPLVLLFTEPIIFLFSLYLSLIYALLYLLFFAVPLVMEAQGFSLGSVGLSFIPILIGMMLTFGTILPWQAQYYNKVTEDCEAKGVPVPPEARLPSMLVGSVLLPIGFLIFAFTSYGPDRVFWIGPMFGTGIFGYAMISIYVGANSYIVDSFPPLAASAMAAKTLLSRVCGGAIPMFVDRMYHSKLGYVWASFVLAMISLLMMPIPFAFFKWGAKIRGMSKRSAE